MVWSPSPLALLSRAGGHWFMCFTSSLFLEAAPTFHFYFVPPVVSVRLAWLGGDLMISQETLTLKWGETTFPAVKPKGLSLRNPNKLLLYAFYPLMLVSLQLKTYHFSHSLLRPLKFYTEHDMRPADSVMIWAPLNWSLHPPTEETAWLSFCSCKLLLVQSMQHELG